MTHLVEPQVFLIGRTVPQRPAIGDWMHAMGADNFDLTAEEWQEKGALLVTLAGKRCYLSFDKALNPNLERVRTDLAAFIDNLLQVGHGSVLEHVSYTFAIEGVSRVFTAEFNRHRAGMAISEGSLRFIRFTDMGYWLPTSLQLEEDDTAEVKRAKLASQAIFAEAFTQMESNYQKLESIWGIGNLKAFKEKKKLTSLFRRIVGMGVATGGVWSGNIRALRHIIEMRSDPAAEEEIMLVVSLLLQQLVLAEPLLFKDFELVDGYWRAKYHKV